MPEYSTRPEGIKSCANLTRWMRTRTSLLLLLAALTTACGGSSPSSPDGGGTPPPAPGSPVSGYLFYDENGNGAADSNEIVRLPSVGVAIGGQNATTATGGRFSIASVPNGAQTGQARPDTLPAYYTATSISLTVPSTGDVPVPARLVIGSRNRPNVYLAFGDSITDGEGSSGGGYLGYLESSMKSFWGKADVVNDGDPGTRSNTGRARLPGHLAEIRPAYTLILYGTNDWNEPACRNAFPCYTIDSLRSMIQDTKSAGAWPIVATIPPVNPNYVDRQAAERNAWVKNMNDLIRSMAAAERCPVAEVYGDFMKQPSLPPLYYDFLHPNDTGYQIISQSFFRAITQPLAGSSAAADEASPALFLPPGRKH
jgi:lysophospholipase L1-like esterase